MNAVTLERTPTLASTLEKAKAKLVQSFIAKIDQTPESVIIDAAKLEGGKALAEIIKKAGGTQKEALSLKARNEKAIAKMRERAFENVKKAYDLLEASDASEILGMTKQALSKKTKSGQVLAYTHNRRKYYPDFQFESNKVTSSIRNLIKSLDIKPDDDNAVNLIIGFLAKPMDFSNPGEEENIAPRYTFLQNNDAFEIIIRDYKNRLEMGK